MHELHLQLYEQSWILRADSSDYNSLAAIAALCPIIYGKGVYEARFLIAKLTGENLDYADDCIELENPNRFASNIPSSEEGKVTVYPNPAYDFITLQFDKYDEKNFQIFMKDITGRTVLLQNCKTIITSLNTKNLPRGVYLIEIKNENKIIFKGKQILQ